MDAPELTILGCGSALPTTKHNLSSQVLAIRNKLYMIDCGEGTQLEFRRQKLNFNKIGHIFLSHLHGDHCFGIPGLISTLGLLGRTADLYIHAQPQAEPILQTVLDFFCKESPFKVLFKPFDPQKHTLIHEDRSMEVYTIPLKHRVPTAGFLFVEKPKKPHIRRDACEFYGVPVWKMNEIKAGANFITPEGELIPHEKLTRPAAKPKKYAYCADTAYHESIIPIIEGVDLLYHEATFTQKDIARARETLHSSAAQAATIAQAAQVKKLLLGHFSARYPNEQVLLDEARSIFPNTELADEGVKIKIT